MLLQSHKDSLPLYNISSQIGKEVHTVIFLFERDEPQQPKDEVMRCLQEDFLPDVLYFADSIRNLTTIRWTFKDSITLKGIVCVPILW